MRIRVRFSSDRPSADKRLSRFVRVLAAARHTEHYGRGLIEAGLATPSGVGRVESIPATLERLEPVEICEFLGNPARFRNPEAPPPMPAPLRTPLPGQHRTAVIGTHVEAAQKLQHFTADRLERLTRFAPEVIAAPASLLVLIAEMVETGELLLPRTLRYLIAFSGARFGSLSEESRDLFWDLFEVPVFEQYLGRDGRLMGWECEAHSGLHLVEENAEVEASQGEVRLTSLTDIQYPALRLRKRAAGELETSVCACGGHGRRLILEEERAVPLIATAATASLREKAAAGA